MGKRAIAKGRKRTTAADLTPKKGAGAKGGQIVKEPARKGVTFTDILVSS